MPRKKLFTGVKLYHNPNDDTFHAVVEPTDWIQRLHAFFLLMTKAVASAGPDRWNPRYPDAERPLDTLMWWV